VKLISQATVSVAAIGDAADRVGAAGGDLDSVVSQEKPLIATATGNMLAATANLNRAAAGIDVAVTEINRPCGTGDSCGTIADVNRTLNSIRLASGQVTAFSLREQTQLDQVNQQETAVADLTEGDLTKLGTAVDGIKDATDKIGALATNKDLTGSLKQTNVALGAVAGMATDTQQYWHSVLHPKLAKRIWNSVTGAGIEVAKFFF